MDREMSLTFKSTIFFLTELSRMDIWQSACGRFENLRHHFRKCCISFEELLPFRKSYQVQCLTGTLSDKTSHDAFYLSTLTLTWQLKLPRYSKIRQNFPVNLLLRNVGYKLFKLNLHMIVINTSRLMLNRLKVVYFACCTHT